ncbi:MAG: DUF1491 family protein [Alphaproteobacteria bacterium]|jgi:hypothetical protein
MPKLKSAMLVSAALRYANAELIDCVVVRRGDGDAGAIFVHVDALDGRHRLLARSLDFNGNYVWRVITGDGDNAAGWVDAEALETRLARELDMDPDAFVIAVADSKARNPFEAGAE